MDRVILSGIELYAYGGVTEAERQIGQRYRVDVDLLLDLSKAARTDDVEDTVNYAEVHHLVVETMRAQPFKLLESAASRVADGILGRFPVEQVTVRLQKLLPPIDGVVESAAVELTRGRTRREA